jgi:hypothetical protein
MGILVLAKAVPGNLRGNFRRRCTFVKREVIRRGEIEVGQVLAESHHMSATGGKFSFRQVHRTEILQEIILLPIIRLQLGSLFNTKFLDST